MYRVTLRHGAVSMFNSIYSTDFNLVELSSGTTFKELANGLSKSLSEEGFKKVEVNGRSFCAANKRFVLNFEVEKEGDPSWEPTESDLEQFVSLLSL